MKAPDNKILVRPVEREIEIVHSDVGSVQGSFRAVKSETSDLLVPVMGNEYDAAIVKQFAVVESVCEYCRQEVGPGEFVEHKISIQPGDLVLTHHFLRDHDVQIEDGLASLSYWQVFAKVDGNELMPNCDWNFIEPLTIARDEREENKVIRVGRKWETNNYGRVIFPSTSLLEMGAKIGDVVMVTGNTPHGGEYDVLFNKKKLNRIHTKEVAAIFVDGVPDKIFDSGEPVYKEKE